ncbi:MAG TPA: OsmC family protein [Candidatus Nitrosotalea sp.]|nr:OsmC family protein [Candidatus Nitrosotalea sp.]
MALSNESVMGPENASIRAVHQGGDRLLMTVRGHELYSDQPVDSGGEDTAATPTEMFLAGLAGCIAFYAERFLRRNGLTTEGLAVTCDYTWAENPHRVGQVNLAVEVPGLTVEKREAFTRVVQHCTLHNTLLRPPAVQLRVLTTQTVSAP